MELCAFKRNNFILNKLLLCLLISMFAFMCLYGSNVYASNDYQFTYNDTNIIVDSDVLSLYPYFLLVNIDSNNPNAFYFFVSEQPITYSVGNDDCYIFYFTGKYLCKSSTISPNSDLSYILTFDNLEGSSESSATRYFSNGFSIIQANHNIYDSNGVLVFQVAPQVTLAPIVEHQEMKPLQEILVILPVVIVVLVGLIAIRKGIIFLIALMKRQ